MLLALLFHQIFNIFCFQKVDGTLKTNLQKTLKSSEKKKNELSLMLTSLTTIEQLNFDICEVTSCECREKA